MSVSNSDLGIVELRTRAVARAWAEANALVMRSEADWCQMVIAVTAAVDRGEVDLQQLKQIALRAIGAIAPDIERNNRKGVCNERMKHFGR